MKTLSPGKLHKLITEDPSMLRRTDENGDNILHQMVKSGNLDAVTYLLSRGHNVTAMNGVACKDLDRINLSTKNNDGLTAGELAYIVYDEQDNDTSYKIAEIITAAEYGKLESFLEKNKTEKKPSIKHIREESKPSVHSSAQYIHELLTRSPEILNRPIDQNGGGILHMMVEKERLDSVIYLLSRGHDITTADGIECKDLTPIDLRATNNNQQTALQVANELYTKGSPGQRATKNKRLIRDVISSAERNKLELCLQQIRGKDLEEFKTDNDISPDDIIPIDQELLLAKENNERNKHGLFSYSFAGKIDKNNSHRKKVEFSTIERNVNHTPDYPAITKPQNLEEKENIKKFIAAYKENDFEKMELICRESNLEFKGETTLDMLAYEAVDKLPTLTEYLITQGSLNLDYKPSPDSPSLQEKYNMQQALEQAKTVKRKLEDAEITNEPNSTVHSPSFKKSAPDLTGR